MQHDAHFPVNDGLKEIASCLALFGYRDEIREQPTGIPGRPTDYYIITQPHIAAVLRGMKGLIHQVMIAPVLYRLLGRDDANEFFDSTYRLGGDPAVALIVAAEILTPALVRIHGDRDAPVE